MAQHKSKNALKTIGEAADLIGEDVHTLRAWEKSFSCIRPIRRHSGHRYFRPKDILLLQVVQKLLRKHGLSRQGVQKIIRQSSHEKLIHTWLYDGRDQSPTSLDKTVEHGQDPLLPSMLPPVEASVSEQKLSLDDPEQPVQIVQEAVSKSKNINAATLSSTYDAASKQECSNAHKQQLKEILEELEKLQQMLDTMQNLSSSQSSETLKKPIKASGKLTTLFKHN